MLDKQRDRFVSPASKKEEAGISWQPNEPMSQFRTQITLYFPGGAREVPKVRECAGIYTRNRAPHPLYL
jgi:hypothetical protein